MYTQIYLVTGAREEAWKGVLFFKRDTTVFERFSFLGRLYRRVLFVVSLGDVEERFGHD